MRTLLDPARPAGARYRGRASHAAMSRRLLISAVTAGLLAVAAPAASAAPALPLGHAGRWITDAQGRVVILHGFNMVYKRRALRPGRDRLRRRRRGLPRRRGLQHRPRRGHLQGRRARARRLRRRLPGPHRAARSTRSAGTGSSRCSTSTRTSTTSASRARAGPTGRSMDDGLPARAEVGLPRQLPRDAGAPARVRPLLGQRPGPGGVGLQDRYAAAWRHVAERFRDDPNVLGYDLLNEPWPGTAWQHVRQPGGLPGLRRDAHGVLQRTIAAIRAGRPAHARLLRAERALQRRRATRTWATTGDAHAGVVVPRLLPGGRAPAATTIASCDTVRRPRVRQRRQARRARPATRRCSPSSAPPTTPTIARRDGRRAPTASWSAGRSGTTAAATTRRPPGPGDKQAIVLDPSKPPTGDNLDAGEARRCCRAPTRRSWPGRRRASASTPPRSASTCATSRPGPAAAAGRRRPHRGRAARAPVPERVRRQRRGRLGRLARRRPHAAGGGVRRRARRRRDRDARRGTGAPDLHAPAGAGRRDPPVGFAPVDPWPGGGCASPSWRGRGWPGACGR